MAKPENDGVQRTLRVARAKGYIRYGELASTLPRTNPGDTALDQVLASLEEIGLQVIADEKNENHGTYRLSEESGDPLQVYLREVAQVPVLSIDRERELMGLLATDANADMVKRELVESQLGLVLDIVRLYRQAASLHILDVVQRRNEGLIKASTTFTAGRPYRFATYASVCVHRSLTDFLESY